MGGPLDSLTVAYEPTGGLYAGTWDHGAYRNDGTNWVALQLSATRVYQIQRVGNGTGCLLAATGNGIWMPLPDVKLSLRSVAPSGATVGAEITYTIDYQTTSNGILSGVVITNAIPLGTELVPNSIEPSAIGSMTDGVVQWNLGDLGPAPVSGTVSYKVWVELPAAGAAGADAPPVETAAHATEISARATPAEEMPDTVLPEEGPLPVGTGTETGYSEPGRVKVDATQSGTIQVVKSSTTTALTAAGQTVPYSFQVTNPGNVALIGVTVTDPNCDAAPLYQSGDANQNNKLDLTETWTYTCDHTVSQAEIDANGGGDGDLDNTVTADSNQAPPDTDTYSIPITYNPLLDVQKSSTTTVITAAGQTVPYSFQVTNPGNVTLTGVTVTDPNCDAAPLYQSGDANQDNKLDLTETWTYTCDHTVTQAEMDAGGNLSNSVTADSVESAEDADTLDIPITYNQLIQVAKS
jgi:uncharacterized repeat protein (TIGR01451 family)